jgi:hypothetical protein
MVLGIRDDQHLGQQHDAERAETAGVHVPSKRVRGAVVACGQQVIDVEHRDLPPAAVLAKRGVVDRAVVIDHEDAAAVVAHAEIGGIAEQPSIQRIRRDLAAADDCLGCAVVRRIESGLERNAVQVRQPAPRREDVLAFARCVLSDRRR